MTSPLRVERDGACWTFSLDVPARRNALSDALVEALHAGVDEAHAAGAQVLAFRGTGANFSAGFDFTDVETQSEGDLLRRFVRIEQLLQAVAASPCVTLAVAHGRNFGAGVDLFAACRRRVAVAGATFRMPGLRFGLVLGTQRFADLVGRAAALEILESTRTFDAGEAEALGFARRVDESLDAAWGPALADAQAAAAGLDAWTRTALHGVLSPPEADDAALAALVRSAARPGLKARIAAYRGAAA